MKQFFLEIKLSSQNVDGQTDRRTDNSALEKLRCLSAGGGANKG